MDEVHKMADKIIELLEEDGADPEEVTELHPMLVDWLDHHRSKWRPTDDATFVLAQYDNHIGF